MSIWSACICTKEWKLIAWIIQPDDLDHSERISIIHDWDSEGVVPKFGTLRTYWKIKIWNFPNSLMHPKLNLRCIRPIKKLDIIGQFSILGVPRLLHGLFLAILCTFLRNLLVARTILQNFPCHTLTFFLSLRIWVALLLLLLLLGGREKSWE